MTNTRLGYEPLTVLVTGGAGFIGSHVAEGLVARGEDVVVLDDLSSGKRENLPEGVDFVEGDVREPQDELFAGVKPTVCYHLAAQIDVRVSVARPDHDAHINVLGTVNILQAALELGTQVVLSSTGGAIYGECERPASEDAPRRPIAPYGTSKLAGEEYLATFNRLHGTRHVSLRYGNVYGPRQDPHGEAGVVAIFFNRLREGDRPKIFGDGSATRDYVYVGDVMRATVAAGGHDGGVFNVGTGRGTSVVEPARGVPADCGHEHRGGVRRASARGAAAERARPGPRRRRARLAAREEPRGRPARDLGVLQGLAGTAPVGPNPVRPVEISAPAVRPTRWRTAAIVVSGLVAFLVLLLIVFGGVLSKSSSAVAKSGAPRRTVSAAPSRSARRSRGRRPGCSS